MKVLGYVNRFSRGVYRVQKELEENGNGQASFDFSLITAFRVVENVSQKYFEEGFGGETAQEKPKKHPRNIQEELLGIIQENPEITRREMEMILGCSTGKIKYYIEKMTKQGLIKHECSTKAGKWVIIK
ncbi:transcriptional regulator [Porphyromonas gingivalis]|nr:winged helix-turn-helix transcriptional regulator [Porphyromonas gingivalis]ATR92680.1 winged helix-turn-helix domain-containing protein [Porphyromonas gingivalis]ATS09069.1 winged helix-turn-helix domain-containing protein [Porphyromonas gingivalis]SJL24094.1 transcriptional regulator [Porphyromonas gingivalis]